MKTTTTPRTYEDAARIVERTASAHAVATMAALLLGLRKDRSAWDKGVTAYALDLLDPLEYYETAELTGADTRKKALLNGAADWHQYSWGGSALCYDGQIAERLCSASELKKTENGARRPNSREEWLDVQARALYQAGRRASDAIAAAVQLLADLAEYKVASVESLPLICLDHRIYKLTPDGWKSTKAHLAA